MIVEIPVSTPSRHDSGKIIHSIASLEIREVDEDAAPLAARVGSYGAQYRLFEGALWRQTEFPGEATLGEKLPIQQTLQYSMQGFHPLHTSKRRLIFIKDSWARIDRNRKDDFDIRYSKTFEATQKRAERVILVDGHYAVRSLPPFWHLSRMMQKGQLIDNYVMQPVQERLDAYAYSEWEAFERRAREVLGEDHPVIGCVVQKLIDFPDELLDHDAAAGALEAAAWLTLSKLGWVQGCDLPPSSIRDIADLRFWMDARLFDQRSDWIGSPIELWPYEKDEFEFISMRPVYDNLERMAAEPRAYCLTMKEANAIGRAMARVRAKQQAVLPDSDLAAISAETGGENADGPRAL